MIQTTTDSSQVAGAPYGTLYSPDEASVSAVSWAAIVGGAVATAALFLSMLSLGAGAGLSSLSPWAGAGATPTAVGIGAVVWLIVVQLVSGSIGGYVAGRLRTKWVGVHSHEVYFRDTAHGFLAWSLAFVVSAGFLGAAATILAGGEVAGSAASRAPDRAVETHRYFVDQLFRGAPTASADDAATRASVSVIFDHALRDRAFTPNDKTEVARVVASRTGLNTADADRRVTQVFEQEQQAVDAARKAVAHSLYWWCAALLIGAFSASLMATFGGRQRDHMPSL